MNASSARKTVDLLAALAAADSLSAFASDSVLSAAKQLIRFNFARDECSSFRQGLGQHNLPDALSRAVCTGWRLWFASAHTPGKHATTGVTELSNALAESLLSQRVGAITSHSSLNRQQALRSVAAAGVIAAMPAAATQIAAALDRHRSLSEKQQQQDFDDCMQHYKISIAIIKVWHGVSNHHQEMLCEADLAATLQPIAKLALAVIRLSHEWQAARVPAMLLRLAVEDALDVACTLADAIDMLAEIGHKFTPAPCVEQLLSAAEFQQLLLVYIGSLTAALYEYSNGRHRVYAAGASEPAMLLDVPGWHEQVLKELSADWAGQLLPTSMHLLVKMARMGKQSKLVAYKQQLSKALCAAQHAFQSGSGSWSEPQKDRMLLPLLRMLVEISALLPHVVVTKYCIAISTSFGSKGSSQRATQVVPCGGTSDDKIVNAAASVVAGSAFTPAAAADIIGPVLDLLAPSVLHILALDSEAALKQYRELYDYGNQEMMGIARLALVDHMSNYISTLALPLEPKHLYGPMLQKPITSLSIIEAAIRNRAAEFIASSSRDSSLRQFSQFIMEQKAALGPNQNMLAFALVAKVTEALNLAATEGKLASVVAAPPAGVEQHQWAGMLSRQLSGLFVTCLKIVQLVGSQEWMQKHCLDMDASLPIALERAHVIGHILSVIAPAASSSSVAVASSASSHAASSNAAGVQGGSDVAQLWIAVAGRCLRLLGQVLSPADGSAKDCSTVSQQEEQLLEQEVDLRYLLPLLRGVLKAAAGVVEWLKCSLGSNMPKTLQENLLQQQEQLCCYLALARHHLAEQTAAQQQQILQLPQLLTTFGSTVCAWVPQQQWCSNLDCHNLGMLSSRRENAVVSRGKCAKCQCVRYCSKDCQNHDWQVGEHKQPCKFWRTNVAAATTG